MKQAWHIELNGQADKVKRLTSVTLAVIGLAIISSGVGLRAQETATSPAFSVATSHVFNTRERQTISLTYRQVNHLDFRVYRVNDAFAFFAGLRDPHQLGSDEPIVPQEQTWLERIARWKAARRSNIRDFLRHQLSPDYRAVRHERQNQQQVVLRQALDVNSFAQVPLLNASQLVTSWREILPPVPSAEYRRVPLDLKEAGIYVVEAVNAPLRAYTVVVVSDVGLITKTAPGELLVFAANRFSGEPLSGCRIQVLADRQPAATGETTADGTFRAALTVNDPDNLVTLAECGGQVAATDPGAYTVRQPSRDLVGYTYTDRPVYRPGHTVHFKSVLRWRERDALSPPGRETVEVSIADESDKVLLREQRTLDEFGALTGSFTIPAAASLGYYRIRIAAGDFSATGAFEVQEYRKPEFDVAVRPAARLELQGRRVSATIAARYYFGQPVAGASVKYVVHKQGYFSPLRADDADGDGDGFMGGYGGGEQILEGTAHLDAAGTAEISIPLAVDNDGRDYTARIEAQVIDASGREVSGAGSLAATFGRFLLIARPERYVYAPGQSAVVNLRALDYAGTPQAGVPVHIALERVEYRSGEREPRVTIAQQADVASDAEGRARVSLTVPPQAGSYRVRASAPSEGRQVTETAYLFVPGQVSEELAGGDQFLELVADRKTYAPGDTAQVVVRGAEFDTSVLVTKESQHVSYHQVVRTRGNEAIALPISEDDIGDTYVSIAFLKDDRLYRAERRLSVPASERQLAVTATADKPIVRPGEPGIFDLHVVDATGAPVHAQLSVGLVDEALYGVRPDTTPDPVRFFYRREYNMVGTAFSREFPFVGYSGTEQLRLTERRRPFTLADFKADRPNRPRVRKDFPDTAFWAGDITTDTNGNAQIRVDYPDSLTSWRLTVRAVTTDTKVGAARTDTVTTKDLILRVVTPKFLTQGDEVHLPTIVHNYLPEAKAVSVSLTADGLTSIDAAPVTAPRELHVAQNGQERSDWAYKAEQPRAITITGKATTDVAGDAVEVTLPVLPAGLQRNAGSSGAILQASPRSIDLTIPPSANPAGRSVRVSLAPSMAGTLLGALDYLTSFPWGCTEQTLSSFIPNLVVLLAMSEMQISPTERLAALDRQVADGLKRIYDYQHDDGGWGWWKTDRNHPFMTAYAVDGLIQARENGVRVEAWRINSGAGALATLLRDYPRMVPDLKAYVVYVLARAQAAPSSGFSIETALQDVWSTRDRMTTSGQAFLLMTLDSKKDGRGDEIARRLIASSQTRGDISWWTVETDPLLDDLGDTSVEASALALKALVARDPANPLLERVARWLVANRTAGAYWVNTKQTALSLEGLLAYMTARGERPAPVTAEVFVNGARAGSASFDAQSLASPNPVLIEAPAIEGTNALRIVTQGAGAIYYDAAVRYYDEPAASDRTGSRALAIVRQYFSLVPIQRDGRIVYREQPFAGTAQAGDLILVRLTAAGATDWKYLILEDPIPAGTEQVEKEDGYEFERRRTWFRGSQRELRDDRTVFFLSDFSAGRYEFSYLLRATTPGTFSAMPARIAPMYVPDVSASSNVTTVTVSPEAAR